MCRFCSNLVAQPGCTNVLQLGTAEWFHARYLITLANQSHSYERILSRLKENAKPGEWETAHKLLGWTICAKRPLKWYEIQCAISIDVEEQTIDFDERKLRVDIRDLCGSLIHVQPGEPHAIGVDARDRIELVHSTAKT